MDCLPLRPLAKIQLERLPASGRLSEIQRPRQSCLADWSLARLSPRNERVYSAGMAKDFVEIGRHPRPLRGAAWTIFCAWVFSQQTLEATVCRSHSSQQEVGRAFSENEHFPLPHSVA